MGRFGMLGLRSLGAWVIAQLTQLGMLAGFYARLSMLFWSAFTRPRLLLAQLHFVGNRSLAITLVSGLFVGFVLGLQGYYTLNRYGSEEALGLLVALSLVRELGPVVAALLFCRSGGHVVDC